MPERSTASARPPRGPAWLRDVPLALALAVVGLVSLRFLGREGGRPGRGPEGPPPFGPVDDVPPDALAAVLVGVAAVALVLRRLRPRWTLVVATAATATYLTLGYPYGPILVSFAVAVFSVARHRPTREAGLWSGAALVALLVHLAPHLPDGSAIAGVVPAAAWVALPFSIGLARRLAADARARARADADERLVDAERLRLAQEVHDVVGHGLAAIQMQADIALHVRASRPGQPEEALRAISAASAEALEELRSTLSRIRPDDAAAHDGSRDPTPGVARLDALCERVRAAGVAVDLEIDGVREPLPAATDLAVYRIVQESLTNVVKHSQHPRAEVRVTGSDDGVEVTVTNEDVHPDDHTPGFGIVGMRRRATQLGGTLTHGRGPRPNTFRVTAALPLPPEESP